MRFTNRGSQLSAEEQRKRSLAMRNSTQHNAVNNGSSFNSYYTPTATTTERTYNSNQHDSSNSSCGE